MIEWKETRHTSPGGRPWGTISFLRGREDYNNTLEGTLITDYAEIHYRTLGADYDASCPDDVIKEYRKELSEALETVARLKIGAEESSYNTADDPDLRLADIYEKTHRDIEETLGRELREMDALQLLITGISLEGLPKDYDGIDVVCYGPRYSIDLESLTVGNWRNKLEEAFKTAAEDFLNSLRDANTVEKILERCNEHFYKVSRPLSL